MKKKQSTTQHLETAIHGLFLFLGFSLLHIPSFPLILILITYSSAQVSHTQQVTTPTGPCLDKPATLSPQLLKNRIKIICLYIFNCTRL